jgi:DNA adenine methylase
MIENPLIQWHGAKFFLRKWIISHLMTIPHKIFVDAFAGSCSIVFSKPLADTTIINDKSGRLVEYLKVLRDPQSRKELIRRIYLTPYARDEFNELMILMNESPDIIERARAFAAGSFMTASSITRKPKKSFRFVQARDRENGGAFSYGPKLRNLIAAIDAAGAMLAHPGVVIENIAAEKLIFGKRLGSPNVLFYIDPPYPLESRSRGKYSKEYEFELSNDEHEHLAELVHKSNAKFVISSNNSTLYERLYQDFKMITKAALIRGGKLCEERLYISPNASVQCNLFD